MGVVQTWHQHRCTSDKAQSDNHYDIAKSTLSFPVTLFALNTKHNISEFEQISGGRGPDLKRMYQQ